MLDNIKKWHVILASNSPRRKDLLKGLGIPFEIRVLKNIDESYPSHLKGAEIPLYISEKKAETYLSSLKKDELLITADTIVSLDGNALGKPETAEEAVKMLKELSGRTHDVFTGVCVSTQTQKRSFVSETKVRFAPLAEDEIEFYVEHFHPLDKAGAYGIQEWIGFAGVEAIEGSYFNVMGLPIQRLYTLLKEF